MTVNVLTLKWGDKYGPDYVNPLYGGVRRHPGLEFRFLCFTDDIAGLRAEVETHPLPEIDLPPAWQHWRRRGAPGNSSVFRFEAGASGATLDRFMRERDRALASYRVPVDQRYLTEAFGPDRAWWPADWVVSFKRHCLPGFPRNLFAPPRLPPAARIVVFHGRPNPHEALAGYRAGRPHRLCPPTPWIAEHWR